MCDQSISIIEPSVKSSSAPACYKVQNLNSQTDLVPERQKAVLALDPELPPLPGQFQLEVFKEDVKVRKGFSRPGSSHERAPRAQIFEFSASSRRNLLKTCRNSGHHITSQFCLTYHDNWPKDGVELKRQIHVFLVLLARHYKGVHYLWVLEFQARTAPHFHLFLDLDVTPHNQQFLAETWLTVSGQSEDDVCRSWHLHQNNFFPWSMVSGSYVSKYAEKAEQKDVPENFHNVGRFWGSSRNMVPKSYIIDPVEVEDVDLHGKIEKAIRSLTKNEEKKRRQGIFERKRLYKLRISEMENAVIADPSCMVQVSEALESLRQRYAVFCKKASMVKKLRDRVCSYTLIFATSLLFQYLDTCNQAGRFIHSVKIPF